MAQRTSDRPIGGRGPWTWNLPALNAGESWTLDLRNMEYEGVPRYFRRFLPLDAAQVGNVNDTEPVRVTFNERYSDVVYPNTVDSYDDEGIVHVRVTNAGSAGISAGKVDVTLELTPYDGDDRARSNARESPLASVVEKFTGLPLGGGR